VFVNARDLPEIALAPAATGTGKSYMACNIAAHKYLSGVIDAVAIIAPMGVHRQWIEEVLPRDMTLAVKTRSLIWKPSLELRKKRMTHCGSDNMLPVLAFNVEAFSADSGRAAKALAEYCRAHRVLLILDESTSVKTPRAIRTKTLIKLAPLAACRMILTGTPITRGIEDLWAQYEFLNPSIIGMSNYFAFRGRYCVVAPAYRGAGVGVVKIVGYRNMEEFLRKIAPVTFSIPKDVLGLPSKVYEEIAVELTDEQRRAYNALRKKLVDDLKAQEIVSPANAAVRIVRLQQVLSGRILVRDSDDPEAPTEVRSIPSRRIAALMSTIENNPDNYVIWGRFTADLLEIEQALKKMGRKPALYYGDMSDEDRANRKKDFLNGHATDFVAQPAIAGLGLDGLQRVADRMVFYSHGFNRLHRWQGEDRLHRMGTTGTVVVLDMVAGPGVTVDRMALDSYKKTEDLIRTFMNNPDLLPEV